MNHGGVVTTDRSQTTAAASTHRRLLLLVVGLHAGVLVLTAGSQIYDTNFYSLWEATALLAGDHPYRDFFEWGIPLQAFVSACAQALVGNRLIGEFAIEWLGIIIGGVVSFHLGLRTSRSIIAAPIMLAFVLPLVATTATYHYPKLLFYPLGTWLIWRYLDAPDARRASAVGLVTAVAFLFRHDHGVYIAAAAALAFVLSCAPPRRRSLRAGWVDAGVFVVTALAILVPWVLLVHSSEGMPQYIESRLQRYAQGSPYSNPYLSLLTMNPMWALTPDRNGAVIWLQQMALLVPLLLLVAVALGVLGSRRNESPPSDTTHITVAAVLLLIVEWRLFREPSYMTAVAPLTVALGTRLLGRPDRQGGDAPGVGSWLRRVWSATRTAVVVSVLALTGVATAVFARDSQIFTPWKLAAGLGDVFAELLVSPPIDGFAPLEEVLSRDRSNWNDQEVHAVEVLLRYVHDCAAARDRVLVTGQTPFQVGYYLEQPIAGGHLFWHEGFRSDPVREQESLALLQRQSVPFAYSTHDPVFDDLKRYPRIHEYMKRYYVELPGSRGRVLVDTRRTPTGEFGELGFPCFR
ncbi:MAG: hypothetical protein HY655_12475 [Acidobacteria bacterium]|nr:hypothetical protein [Acidobacteriota bacterium]